MFGFFAIGILLFGITFESIGLRHILGKTSMNDTILEIDLQWIVENPHQPRKSFSTAELEELAASIEEIGLIHPPVVREIGSNEFELVAGERRLRALKLLGRKRAQVVVSKMDEPNSAHSALIENIQRVDLNAMEVAYALRELMKRFQLTQELLADKVGKKRSTVANFLRLLQLPGEIQDFLRNDTLSMGHAKAVLSLPEGMQRKFCKELIEGNLSVREAEQKAKEILKKKTKPLLQEKSFDVHLKEIKAKLEEKLGTKVEISDSKIVIDYYGFDDLDRLLEILNV